MAEQATGAREADVAAAGERRPAPAQPTLNQLLARLLAAPLLVLGVVTAVLSVQLAQMLHDADRVDHTDRVIAAIYDLQRNVLDEETGIRGYQVSADRSFLEPFERARVEEKLTTLRALVAENPAQLARIAALSDRHRAWRADTDQVIASGDPRSLAHPHLVARKQLMDGMRADVDGLLSVERGQRAERDERAQRSRALSEGLTIALLLGLGVILLGVSRKQVAQISRTFGFAIDAERHARETSEALVANLQRQASFRDTFLRMLGHDLRNPLTAVSIAASFALEQPELSEKTRRMLARIGTSGERMGRMVDQLIDLTRARLAEAFPITRARVDLGAVVLRVIEERRQQYRDQLFALTREGDLTLEADEARLEQVLANVLGNAAVHGRAGGEISVAVRGNASRIVVLVRNQGEPIPAAIAAKLFDPFQRGPEDKTRSEALGLGLYISRRIVEAHGGSLRLASDPTSGVTELAIELPRSPPAD